MTKLQANDPAVTSANFSNQQLGDDAIVNLCNALSKNTSCRVLDISNNQFGLPGLLSVAQLISTNHVLTQLNLSYNQLDPRGALALSKVLPTSNVQSVNLQNCGGSTSAILMSMMRTSRTSTSSSAHRQQKLAPSITDDGLSNEQKKSLVLKEESEEL